MRAERLLEEAKGGAVQEGVQARLRWEDWSTLLPELITFASAEIAKRRWRGAKSGVLPEGFDANGVASEVVMVALQGKARIAPGWTRERLLNELKRKLSHEVRRLHKLKERAAVRSEWDVPWPDENGELRSVFAGMRSQYSGGSGWDDGQVRDKVRKETELKIVETLREEDGQVQKLFECLRSGVVKRREIAERLELRVSEVTNCRKQLDRKLNELEKAGCAGWAIEEWKRK